MRRSDAEASQGRSRTFRSIECDTAKLDVSGSGSAATSFSDVASPHDTKPSGGFFRTSFRFFLGSSPALATAFSFPTTCSGDCTPTAPSVSYPARPARPAHGWNWRAGRGRGGVASHLDRGGSRAGRSSAVVPHSKKGRGRG